MQKYTDLQSNHITGLDKIFEISWGFASTSILITSFELNLFDIIEDGIDNNEDISKYLQCDFQGLSSLLNALTGIGLLEKQAEKYTLPIIFKPYLLSNSPYFVGHIWKVHKKLNWDIWSKLTDSIKTGKPVIPLFSANGEDLWTVVIPYLNSIAINASKEISNYLKSRQIHGEAMLLDIGCGSGIYSQTIVQNCPHIKAIGIDQENVLKLARKQTKQLGLADRIDYIEDDIFKFDYQTEYFDIVLVSNILHGYNETDNLLLLNKIFNSLKPNGLLIINDFIINKNNKILLPLLLSLQFHLTGNGKSFELEELKQLMLSSGFQIHDYQDIPGPFSMLVCNK
ncbi:hypothetical protein COF42_25625 [Bacillus wiedmannii]|uniref:class I SAM-dependent methyltransferase n=1 Tax=Bacillus wiedmannii TaxID=1890302 RepID=UPI000BFDC3F6|nr:class I SAM-dependent methyltransferase [Bacillus wiedmannii]PHC82974.1 hypothetical protein COF42_25625 [Bacillus wiedmannii]